MFLDVPSPSNAYLYTYGDHDQYLDASHSETQSSATSPVWLLCPSVLFPHVPMLILVCLISSTT